MVMEMKSCSDNGGGGGDRDATRAKFEEARKAGEAKLLAGEPADLMILSRTLIDELVRDGYDGIVTVDRHHRQLQPQCLDGPFHDRHRPDDQRQAKTLHFSTRQGFGNHLRSDAGRIAHGDSKKRQ